MSNIHQRREARARKVYRADNRDTFQRVKNAALPILGSIAIDLIGTAPTKRSKHEWRFSQTGDGKGASLAVHLGGRHAGLITDFKADQSGDVFDLYRWYRGGSVSDALAFVKKPVGLDR